MNWLKEIKMIKYFCDRCEKEISEYDYKLNKLSLYTDVIVFCDDCVEDFNLFIANRIIAKPCDTHESDK